MTFHTIMMIEQMKNRWRWLPWCNSNPPIYRSNREIWLDIVDLDENLENRVYTEIGKDGEIDPKQGGEGAEADCPETISFAVPHHFVENVLRIIQAAVNPDSLTSEQARVAKKRGYTRQHQTQVEYNGR